MKYKPYAPHKASFFNINANALCMAVYLLTALGGVVFYTQYVVFVLPLAVFFLEKDSFFIRFHALQTTLLALFHLVIQILLRIASGVITGVIARGQYDQDTLTLIIQGTSFLGAALVLAVFIFSLLALRGASNYQEYRIPLFGRLAKKYTTITTHK